MKTLAARLISAGVLVLWGTVSAQAQEVEPAPKAFSFSILYKADVTGVAAGGMARGARFLDNLDLVADADLDRAIGWNRTVAHVSALNNLGGRPNDLAGSIQGIDNIEVANPRLKLYEAWLERGFGEQVTLRTGLYDVNSEFYQNDAAGLLISPMFGVGSELASTGTNGPSIFPSTALAARLRFDTGREYAAFAVINARAGTLGDEGGVDFSGNDGALLIAEAGLSRRGKFAVGAWRYTRRQPVIVPPGVTLAEATHRSEGVYVLAEQDLVGEADGAGRHLAGFVRLGLSDGRTTPFRGGWQGGVLIDRPFAARPASALSLGVGNGALSNNYRDSNPVALPPLKRSETILEVTYRDEIVRGVSLQPDIQYVINPSADPTIDDALVLGLRLTIGWSS